MLCPSTKTNDVRTCVAAHAPLSLSHRRTSYRLLLKKPSMTVMKTALRIWGIGVF